MEKLTLWQAPLPAGKHLAEQLVWDPFHKNSFQALQISLFGLDFATGHFLTSPVNALLVPGCEEVKWPCQLFQGSTN